MSIDLPAAWDAVGQAVEAVTGLNVFPFVPESLAPPAAVVTLDTITFDNTKQRGTDRALFKVWVAVGKAHDQSAQAAIAGYASGAGTTSTALKSAIDALGPEVRCTQATIGTLNEAGQEFLAAIFDVDYVA